MLQAGIAPAVFLAVPVQLSTLTFKHNKLACVWGGGAGPASCTAGVSLSTATSSPRP
jgi:hypothetical protein